MIALHVQCVKSTFTWKHQPQTFFAPYPPQRIVGAGVLQVGVGVLAGSLQAGLDQQNGVGQDGGPQLGQGTHHKELPSSWLAWHLVAYRRNPLRP